MKARVLMTVCVAWLGCSGLGVASQAPTATDSVKYAVDIPAQNLGDALQAFALASHHKLFYSSDLVAGKKSPPLLGQFTTEEGVKRLLANADLQYEVTSNGLVMIRSASAADSPADVVRQSSADNGGKEGKKDSSQDFRVAQLDQTTLTSGSQVEGRGDHRQEVLDEVVVTAQKRSEKLMDTPVPVTVVNTDALTENNQLRLQDFFTSVPGLSMTQGVLNNEFLSIRGISNQIARGSTTVGVVVDDAPFGANTAVQVSDIDPGELQQIEVLRGPQGTLYGSSSMGGLLKYVMVEPSTTEFSTRVQAGLDTIYNAAKLGYTTRASANLPVNETLAFRVSAFMREDPGYIDDVETAQEGVNVAHTSGGHVAGLWRPADGWSLKLNAFYTNTVAQGVNGVDIPTAGYPQSANLQDLQQYRARGSGYNEVEIQQYSATLDGKLGPVDVKSITAYNKTRIDTTADYSTYFSGLAQQDFNVSGALAPQVSPTEAVSQEVRFSGSVGRTVDWLAGGFFTHQDSDVHDSIQPEDPLSGIQTKGNLFYEQYIEDYRESAGFVDFTFHVTDRFDVQAGGRESRIFESYGYYSIGDLNGSPTAVYGEPTLGNSANAFTYLFTPSYKITPDTMVYARLASGFRAGTLNPTATGAAFGGIPLASDPDKTYNYEVGIKGDFLGHRLSVDASAYYIDWKHIQLLVIETVQGLQASFTTNGGDAKSEGLELTLTARPLAGMTLTGWFDYDDAVLKQGFPGTSPFVGAAGDRLPFTSRYSAHLAGQQEFPLWGELRGFGGASLDYVGDRIGDFQVAGVTRQYYPSYVKADVQAGVKFGAWTINTYANNLTNRRGEIATGVDFPPPASSVTYIEPRNIGINFIWKN